MISIIIIFGITCLIIAFILVVTGKTKNRNYIKVIIVGILVPIIGFIILILLYFVTHGGII